MASLAVGFAVAGGIVVRSAGGSELAEFDSVLPNIHHQLVDQTVDNYRRHVKPSFLVPLYALVLPANQRFSLCLLRRRSLDSASQY